MSLFTNKMNTNETCVSISSAVSDAIIPHNLHPTAKWGLSGNSSKPLLTIHTLDPIRR